MAKKPLKMPGTSMKALKLAIADKNHQIEELTQDLANQQKSITGWETAYDKQAKVKDDLKKQVKALTTNYAKKSRQFIKAKDGAYNQKNFNDSLSGIISALREEVEELKNNAHNDKEKLGAQRLNTQTLQDEIDRLEANISRKDQESAKTQKELDSAADMEHSLRAQLNELLAVSKAYLSIINTAIRNR